MRLKNLYTRVAALATAAVMVAALAPAALAEEPVVTGNPSNAATSENATPEDEDPEENGGEVKTFSLDTTVNNAPANVSLREGDDVYTVTATGDAATNGKNLQEAINNSQYSTIYVQGGEYYVTNETENQAERHNLLIERDNVKVVGIGEVKITAEFQGTYNGKEQQTILITGDNVTLENLTVYEIKGYANKTVEIQGAANVTVNNCTIYGTSSNVYVGEPDSTNYTITNNKLLGGGCICITNGAGGQDGTNGAGTITGNTMEGPIYLNGLGKKDGSYAWMQYDLKYLPKIENNTFTQAESLNGVQNYLRSFSCVESGTTEAPVSGMGATEMVSKEYVENFVAGNTFTNNTFATNGEYTYFVYPGDPNTAYYGMLAVENEDQLKAFVADAEPGSVIHLANDITLSDTVTIDKDITIDGDGHTIKGNFTGNDIVGFLVEDGTATFLDMDLKNFDNATAPYGSVIKIDAGSDNAKVVADGLNISSFARDAFTFKAGSFEVRNTTVDCEPSAYRNNQLTKGFQIGFGTSHVTGLLENVDIKNSSSDYDDWSTSAIEIYNDAEVTIKGGSIQDCKQGIWVDNYWAGSESFPSLTGDATVVIDGTTIDAQEYAVVTYGREGTKNKASVTIKGGNFNGKLALSASTGNEKITVLGGTFDSDPSEFIPEGYQFETSSDGSFVVKPVVVEKPTEETTSSESTSTSSSTTTSSSSTTTTTTQSGSSIPYYTCKACGYHDWTATADGYKCDHCGYIESVKQLSGYGNVKGTYEPKASSAAAQSASAATASATATSAIPQTSDESNPMLWVVLLLISGGAFASMAVYSKKKKTF